MSITRQVMALQPMRFNDQLNECRFQLIHLMTQVTHADVGMLIIQ